MSRIDRDQPQEGDAYVLRLETGDGRRLKATLTYRELAMNLGTPVGEMIAAAARQLADRLPVTIR